jgi:hypothetical protein
VKCVEAFLLKHKRCGVVDEMTTKSYQHQKEMSIVTEHGHQKDFKMEKANGERTTILIDNTSITYDGTGMNQMSLGHHKHLLL